MDAFDADCLIYAAAPGHPLGRRVLVLFTAAPATAMVGVGSVLLVPEVLARPLRDAAAAEVRALSALLARLELQPLDRTTANLATALAAKYRLKALDAAHLATAVVAGADRFLTNNSRDFSRAVTETDVVYPKDLPDPVA